MKEYIDAFMLREAELTFLSSFMKKGGKKRYMEGRWKKKGRFCICRIEQSFSLEENSDIEKVPESIFK